MILEWNILHRVDSLIYTPKNSNHLRSHSKAIMALDYSRLIRPSNKFLENKSGRIFCVRQVYPTKSCQQIWGWVNQPFVPFIHHIWHETVLRGAVFIIPTSERCGISQFFKTNCTESIFKTINRGLLAKLFKTFPKLPIPPAGSHFWQGPNFQCELCGRVFLFNGFITMCDLKKHLIRAAFWVLLQAMFMTENIRHSDWNCMRDY